MTLLPGLATAAISPAPPTVSPTTPIVKWVGGKTRLLDNILPLVPKTYDRYFEPFAGGAALFFRLAPAKATLTDANPDLIAMYQVVRDRVEDVIAHLELAQESHSAEFYDRVRTLWNAGIGDPISRAAAFIYLNKTCFNGLWRVNRSGAFNVPMGKYKNPGICKPDALRAASKALATCDLRSTDYKSVMTAPLTGPFRDDFVYIDPPYHETFTSYTAGAFGEQQQRELASCARGLARQGTHVLLSNSDTPLIRELYADFEIHEVRCGRAVNSNGAGRGAVTELLIRSRMPGVN